MNKKMSRVSSGRMSCKAWTSGKNSERQRLWLWGVGCILGGGNI